MGFFGVTKQEMRELLGIEEGKDSELGELRQRVLNLKAELEELRLKKKMEEIEIEHLVKLKEEKQGVEFQKKELGLEKQFQQKEMVLMKDFHNKTLELLEKKSIELGKIHEEILKRLPDINMTISKRS
jgi:hypothetical protein